ncbi:MAG: DUF1801 domain-containing protein [Alkalibacterium sp.]|uniref:DUF1801 domain-containing protein n=1 Tax=Alkalibacterium sp. TaxID=1872447 RepID=UPI0039708A1F
MYKLKTQPTDASVVAFIDSIEDPKKQEDAFKLLDIFSQTTGMEPKMWGSSIIGYGAYHYKYDSGHEGDSMLVGFSPRKARFSLYFATGDDKREELLKEFGKYKSGKACVYVNKLDDINSDVLQALIHQSIAFLTDTYGEENITKE